MLIQKHSTSIRPIATAHLAQTMTLLGLNAEDLRQRIESELAANPALELAEPHRCPSCRRVAAEPGLCAMCRRAAPVEEPIVFVSPREDFRPSLRLSDPDRIPEEELAAEVEALPAYVMRQIAAELAPQDRPLAAHILTSLDEDGLLSVPLIEIARYHHVPLSRVMQVLRQIQHADPAGVGSPSAREALLVQLEILAETRPVPELATRAIQEGMNLLSRRQYTELGRLLGISTVKARQVAEFISENLNPFPARAGWGEHHGGAAPSQVYHHPDVLISLADNGKSSALVVEVISPMAGRLRVNPLFRHALQQAPDEKSEAWQNDLERATLLVKCLQQRDHTLVRLMQRLAVIQRQYILLGDAHLAPVTRASLAEELDVHESTISRAVSDKAVQLPSGRIIPLSRMFDRSLHIRTALREIISQEAEPLTDIEIAARLEKLGYDVARRTVAKYRSMEGILPAYLRNAPQAPKNGSKNAGFLKPVSP